MTIFEYLMVLVSIILGLGMTQVLRGLSKIVRGDKRYATVTIWACGLAYLYIQNWWALWDLHAVEAWNQGYFTLVILLPCVMFGATELLLPMSATAKTDWRAHYFSVRRWFFIMMLILAVLGIASGWLLMGVPLTHPYRVAQAALMLLFCVGLVSDKPQIQPWIAGGTLGVLLVGQALFRFVPGIH